VKLLKLPNHSSKPQGFRPSRRSLAAAPRFFRRPPQPLNFRGPASPVLQPTVALRRPIWARPSARGRSRHGAAAWALGVRALDSLGSAPYLTLGPPRARPRPPGAAAACLAPKPPPPVDLKCQSVPSSSARGEPPIVFVSIYSFDFVPELCPSMPGAPAPMATRAAATPSPVAPLRPILRKKMTPCFAIRSLKFPVNFGLIYVS
jgi:hypothetical protein